MMPAGHASRGTVAGGSEFAEVSTAELIRLNNMLSGGYWLGRVRRALNFRTIWERETIRRGVDAHSWNVIGGRR